jgi:hypothetical protein
MSKYSRKILPMDSNEKVFRHSYRKIYLVTSILLGIGVMLLLNSEAIYILLGFLGLMISASIYYLTIIVRISDVEITSRNWLGSKSLCWNEIARVSTRGQNIRLCNSSEDITLSIDAQMDRYEEILDILYKQRPDLFDADKHDTMSVGTIARIVTIGLGLLAIAASIPFMYDEEMWFLSPLFIGLGLWIIVVFFLSPKSAVLENDTLHILYFFRENSFSVEEIQCFSLEKRRTRDGYIYFVQVKLKNGKPIKLSTTKPGSVVTYQILKRWHEKAKANRSIFSR